MFCFVLFLRDETFLLSLYTKRKESPQYNDFTLYISPQLFLNLGLSVENDDIIKVTLRDISKLIRSNHAIISSFSLSSSSAATTSKEKERTSNSSMGTTTKHSPQKTIPHERNVTENLIGIASEVHIARVITPTSSGYVSYTHALQRYFTVPRILKVGDIITVPIKRRRYIPCDFEHTQTAIINNEEEDEEEDEEDEEEDEDNIENNPIIVHKRDKDNHSQSFQSITPNPQTNTNFNNNNNNDRYRDIIYKESKTYEQKRHKFFSKEKYIEDLVHFKVIKMIPSTSKTPTNECYEFMIVEREKTSLYQEGALHSRIPPLIHSFFSHNNSSLGTISLFIFQT